MTHLVQDKAVFCGRAAVASQSTRDVSTSLTEAAIFAKSYTCNWVLRSSC